MAIVKQVKVPDIGDFKNVGIIEILVHSGEAIKAEQPVITLESDKATMEIPSPYAGTVKDLAVNIGDKVSEGSLIFTLEINDPFNSGATTISLNSSTEPKAEKVANVVETSTPSQLAPTSLLSQEGLGGGIPAAAVKGTTSLSPTLTMGKAGISADPRRPLHLPTSSLTAHDDPKKLKPHAGPAVRHLARELGVELTRVTGSGKRARILKEDVTTFVKTVMTEGSIPNVTVPLAGGGAGIPPMPEIDFSKFGEIETAPLSRIKKLSGASLYRAWLNVPQVTQFDTVDITELEAFRQGLADEAKKRNVKVTMLAFLLKASVAALKQFPHFNSSLDSSKDNLIVKKYYHLGVAVDTPNGLVVPVIREVNLKGLFDLAAELATISQKARDGKLSAADMQGASFTISSLGGIGGTGFTPIVNAPEVAILGVSRSQLQPVYQAGQFIPRLMLPFSLSYDHRVVDGAAAARFTSYLSFILSDVRRLLL